MDPLADSASTVEEEASSLQPTTTGSSSMFDHYVSPCEYRVSNDPLIVTESDVCDATIYGCVRDHSFLIQSNDNVKEISLTYDYDMYYQFNSQMHNFRDMQEFLEGSMLEHLASVLDLKQCPTTTATSRLGESGPPQRRILSATSRKLQGFSEEQKAYFIAINSEPGDFKSIEHECMSPPEDGTYCQSMVGLMTVYLENARISDSEIAAIEATTYEAVAAGMNSDTHLKGAIKGLTYIGDRSTPAPTVDATGVAAAPPGTLGTPDEPALVPEISPEKAPEISGNSVVAVSQGEPIAISGSDEGSLEGAQIGLISAASAILIVAALVGLLLSKRRRRVESLDEDDGAFGAYGVSSKGSPPRSFFPVLAQQLSLEGAEIPGSLASQDAMALKPQYKRAEDDNSCVGGDSKRSEPAPRTPARVTNVAQQEDVALQASSSSQEVTLDAGVLPTPSVLPPSVPLSPVHNTKSGFSPSRVSPRRLPNSLNAPFVASRRDTTSAASKRVQAESPSSSILDQLVAEIDAERGSPPRSSRKSQTIETLERIAHAGSGSTTSFQDTAASASVNL